MLIVPPITHMAHVQTLGSYRYRAFDRAFDPWDAGPSSFFSCERLVEQIQVGATEYVLRSPTLGRFYPLDSGRFEFVVDGFGDHFVGRGDTRHAADQGWRDTVHACFQRLLSTRPFEMNDEDRILWNILEERIDVAKYRRTTPMTLRQVGRARYVRRAIPTRIDWANQRKDYVSLESMPAAFAALKPNQWFEAVVERDPLTGRLLKVLSVRSISTLRLMTMDQQRSYLQSLPKGEELSHPESDPKDRD